MHKLLVSITFLLCTFFCTTLIISLDATPAVADTPVVGKTPVADKRQASARQCARWRRQLGRIQEKLRAGYTTESGKKLYKRRRELEQKLYERCRKRHKLKVVKPRR